MIDLNESRRLFGMATAQALAEKFESALAGCIENDDSSEGHKEKMCRILAGERAQCIVPASYSRGRLPLKKIIAIAAIAVP